MIHWEYRRDQDMRDARERREPPAPGQPDGPEFASCGGASEEERRWARAKALVRQKSAPTEALLNVQARVEVDAARREVRLAVHPGLHAMLSGQTPRRALVEEAVRAAFGRGWTLAVARGPWADEPAPLAPAAERPAEAGRSPFERARRQTPEGDEYWSSRDLAVVLGYASHRSFEAVVERARTACANAGHDPADHFAAARALGEPGRETYLSRYACYLIIQNSDPAKASVAQGQSYFAHQARRQEVADQAGEQEDQRRLMLRQEVAAHNKKLAAAARTAGVVEAEDFREFQNQGYKGLYGGLGASMLRARKGLEPTANVLDFMGSTELAANLFRATQTEEKIRRDRVRGKEEACRLHRLVGAKVRQTMAEISGAMPEALPVVEDIRDVRKRLKARQVPEGQGRLRLS
jgi:DNA-damage-inducible protein D